MGLQKSIPEARYWPLEQGGQKAPILASHHPITSRIFPGWPVAAHGSWSLACEYACLSAGLEEAEHLLLPPRPVKQEVGELAFATE